MIANLKCETVILEEAAEILEAHTLSCLTPSTEHLILIGDHLQLRPKIQLYELSLRARKGFNLDLSLFERLVSSPLGIDEGDNGRRPDGALPLSILAQQRRMSPCISNLIHSLYPALQNHPDVTTYPEVRGMADRLFFFDHDHPEAGQDEGDDSKSKSNDFEVKMIAEFCRYLLHQGYGDKQITVITPYVGQLLKMKKYMNEQQMMTQLGELDEEQIDTTALEEEDDSDSAVPARNASPKKAAPVATTVKLGNVVRIVTIDNFQVGNLLFTLPFLSFTHSLTLTHTHTLSPLFSLSLSLSLLFVRSFT